MSILAGLIAGHRHVFVVEHSDFRRARNDRPSTAAAIGFAIAPFVYSRAEKVICVSQSVCDSIPFLPGGRVRRGCVIANPISSEEFVDTDSEVNPHPWFAERVPVLVACGRFTPAKNYEMMLYAFASIMTRIPARLIILGEGPERDKIINLATALSVSRNVTFAGFQQKPGRYFAKARLFISSSAWEGLPMTMIEALFSGANMVVTHSCSDAPHLVNRGLFGSCVDSWSADCFADAIIKELDRPVASLAAKREFLSKYSLPKIAAEYGALFASAYSAVKKKQS
jgi:glycosyltransferase involved in cell wall biosynthesis